MIVHPQKKTSKKIKAEEFKAVRTVQDVVDAPRTPVPGSLIRMSGALSRKGILLLTSLLLLAWPCVIWLASRITACAGCL